MVICSSLGLAGRPTLSPACHALPAARLGSRPHPCCRRCRESFGAGGQSWRGCPDRGRTGRRRPAPSTGCRNSTLTSPARRGRSSMVGGGLVQAWATTVRRSPVRATPGGKSQGCQASSRCPGPPRGPSIAVILSVGSPKCTTRGGARARARGRAWRSRNPRVVVRRATSESLPQDGSADCPVRAVYGVPRSAAATPYWAPPGAVHGSDDGRVDTGVGRRS